MDVLVICNRHEKAKMHDVILSHQLLRERFEDVEFRQSRVRPVPGLRWVLQIGDVETVELCGGEGTRESVLLARSYSVLVKQLPS